MLFKKDSEKNKKIFGYDCCEYCIGFENRCDRIPKKGEEYDFKPDFAEYN